MTAAFDTVEDFREDPFVNTFARDRFRERYAHDTVIETKKESWWDLSQRVANAVMQGFDKRLCDPIANLIYKRKFIPGGRYLYCAGRPVHQVNNCFLFKAKDSREGWGDLLKKIAVSIMTGGGCGTVYSSVRGRGSNIQGMGGQSSGSVSLMKAVNAIVEEMRQGGTRRAALWGGLHWSHADIDEFIRAKIWPEWVVERKREDFSSVMAPLEFTNISVIFDTEWHEAVNDTEHDLHLLAKRILEESVRIACEHADPGWSFDMDENEGENLRNACTEVTSRYDSDMCNLGSILMPNMEDIDDFERTCDLVTKFLIAGTEYTDLPMPEMDAIRKEYRRIGVGLMGVHEWMMQRRLTFRRVAFTGTELNEWLQVYEDRTNETAYTYSRRHGINEPIKKRAIAPTGTISIVGETTSGIEPMNCLAYKRTFYKGSEQMVEYVIDRAGKAAMEKYGYTPDKMEDAYTLSEDIETRIAYQARIQDFVDMGISSTALLAPWGSDYNNEDTAKDLADLIRRYSNRLRGFTVYPDGCRYGQPIVKCPYEEAWANKGKVFKFSEMQQCKLEGGCGD